jgi:hypothetical protein
MMLVLYISAVALLCLAFVPDLSLAEIFECRFNPEFLTKLPGQKPSGESRLPSS